MKIFNKAMVDALFQRDAVLIGHEDCVPERRTAILFGEDAVKHAKSLRHWNGYGIGDFTLGYLTYKGFLAAASYSNIRQLQKESGDAPL